MIRSVTVLVSDPEYRLLEAVRQIQYGELYGVQVSDEGKHIDYQVSPAMRGLLRYLRDGVEYIDILTVHNGQPVLAETNFRLNGFRCRKKVKFPTEREEG